MFNNSILENIRVGRKDATDEEVIEAARLAECEEFVFKLPNGYDTVIGENGELLSGGQRQKNFNCKGTSKRCKCNFIG